MAFEILPGGKDKALTIFDVLNKKADAAFVLFEPHDKARAVVRFHAHRMPFVASH
jgi:hypothetical protein